MNTTFIKLKKAIVGSGLVVSLILSNTLGLVYAQSIVGETETIQE